VETAVILDSQEARAVMASLVRIRAYQPTTAVAVAAGYAKAEARGGLVVPGVEGMADRRLGLVKPERPTRAAVLAEQQAHRVLPIQVAPE